MGDKGNMRYFHIRNPYFSATTMKVAVSEVSVENPMPLTLDRNEWVQWWPPEIRNVRKEVKASHQ